MGLYALDENYDVSTWYEYNGAYDLNAGTDLALDLSRYIINSDAYVFQGVAFPKGDDIEIDFQQTFSGSLNLIPYSYVVGLTGFSRNGGQYTLRIYDKGAQTDVYFRQFAWYPTVVGTMQLQWFAAGEFIQQQDRDIPFGPYFFRDPLIVLPPGQLQIQITNAEATAPPGTNPQLVQLLFMIAVPKSTVSLNTRKIVSSSDPSGIQSLGELANIAGGV
jgi:hypothetical protein